jgi:ferredoxin
MPDAANPSRRVLTVRLGDAPSGAADGAILAEPGDTLLVALRRAETGIRSICGGRCACGTCRVAVEPEWVGRMPAASRNEARLLAVLPGALPAHRLACQITLDEQTDGIVLRLDTPLRPSLAKAGVGAQSTTAMETNP